MLCDIDFVEFIEAQNGRELSSIREIQTNAIFMVKNRYKKLEIEGLEITAEFQNVIKANKNRIVLSSVSEIVFLDFEEILHLKSDGCYTTFYTKDGKTYFVTLPMKNYEELLPKSDFYKLHQSHIVNMNFVKRILKEDGSCYVIYENGIKLPISRRKKEEFINLLKTR
jgi:two-component system LytT family response regulator